MKKQHQNSDATPSPAASPPGRVSVRSVRQRPLPRQSARIDTKSGRDSLVVRREPYWAKLTAGRYLGFRKLEVGGTWIARYRTEDGEQQYKALGELLPAFGFDQAKALAEAWFKDLDRGVTGKADDGEVATVKTACKRYVDDRRKNKSEACAHDAEKRFERTVTGKSIADLPLAKFRTRHLKEWLDGLDTAGLSKPSANRTLAPLKAALHLAVTDGLATADLLAEIERVPPHKAAGGRRDLYLDKDQRTALLAACSGHLRHLVEAALLTGCRAGELTSATRAAYDHRTKTLKVTGKTGPRNVPLSPKADALFAGLAKGKLPGAYLLTKDGANRWQHSDWDELVRAAADEAKLPAGVCLYTLRHSWITAALLGGMSTLEVSKIAGTGLTMIEKHYGHLVNDVARERLAKVEII